MQIDDWLTAACADAERRGLAQMKPLLESLARSTVALREMDRSIRTAAHGSALPGSGVSACRDDGPR